MQFRPHPLKNIIVSNIIMSNNILENYINNKTIYANNYFEYKLIIILCKKFIPYVTMSINIQDSVFDKKFKQCYNYNKYTDDLDYPVYLSYYNNGFAGPYRERDTRLTSETMSAQSLFKFIKNHSTYL